MVLVGILGLSAELALLEHWESWRQWLPFAGLGLGLVATVLAWARPSRTTLRAFQGTMGVFLALGVLGLWLHYRGNVEFELEMDPDTGGWALVRHAVTGATPLLAPGALVQSGLVGLAATFRHPGLRRRPGRDVPSTGA